MFIACAYVGVGWHRVLDQVVLVMCLFEGIGGVERNVF